MSVQSSNRQESNFFCGSSNNLNLGMRGWVLELLSQVVSYRDDLVICHRLAQHPPALRRRKAWLVRVQGASKLQTP